jgi:hypothetical protein
MRPVEKEREEQCCSISLSLSGEKENNDAGRGRCSKREGRDLSS